MYLLFKFQIPSTGLNSKSQVDPKEHQITNGVSHAFGTIIKSQYLNEDCKTTAPGEEKTKFSKLLAPG